MTISPERRARVLTPVLVVVGMVIAVISSLGAPLIPTVATMDHVPLSQAQWSLTVTLIVGAISSPVMGRLGDGRRRREVILAGLVVVGAGSVVAALSGTSLAVLIVGRAMQGVGLGLMPLTMAVARDHLPGEQGRRAIAALSVSTAAGVGLGYPLTGVVAELLGFHAAFWFGAAMVAVALALALPVVPAGIDRGRGGLDLPGAAVMTAALAALLIAISEGHAWGWTSDTTIAVLAAAAVLGAAWVVIELRSVHPVVDLRLLRHRSVATADIAGILLGIAMYLMLSLITDFVQTPTSEGYGFGSSIVVAGLTLLPLSLMSVLASRAAPAIDRRVGSRVTLTAGSLMIGVGALLFALSRDHLWQAFLTTGVVGLGLGFTFAAMPGFIVRAVPPGETGSAMGFYQVARYVGFALGSAIGASVLGGHTPAGELLPTNTGYGVALMIGVGVCVLTALLTWLLPGAGVPARSSSTAMDELMEVEGELGGAGVSPYEEDVGADGSARRPA